MDKINAIRNYLDVRKNELSNEMMAVGYESKDYQELDSMYEVYAHLMAKIDEENNRVVKQKEYPLMEKHEVVNQIIDYIENMLEDADKHTTELSDDAYMEGVRMVCSHLIAKLEDDYR